MNIFNVHYEYFFMINLIFMINYPLTLHTTIGRGYLTMSSLSADAPVFHTKYDEDFPPIERENTEVVKLRKELSKTRHQLICRNAKISDLEMKTSQLRMRADWLEHWKDKFKKKAENTEEENKRLRESFNEQITEIQSLYSSLEKKNKELDDMKESRVVLREDHELQISRNERRHLKALADLQDECDKNISSWVENNRKLEAEVAKLKEKMDIGLDTYNSLNDRYRSVLAEVRELRNTSHVNEEWIGRSLKLKWIFDEMLKVGAVKLPDHEWATDMVQEIEFPSGSGNSVFYEVSRHIRERYLPSIEDAHMEWVEEDDENELIRRLSEEASDFSNSVDNSLFASLETDRENTIKHIIVIQKHIRGYLAKHNLKEWKLEDECWSQWKIDKAIIIQKYWRRFYTSPIRYQNYSAFGEQAPGVVRIRYRADCDVYGRSITLVNTGCIDYQYRYIVPGRGPGTQNTIRGGSSQNISTYATHWFHISVKIDAGCIARKIRIPIMLAHGIGSGYFGSKKWVFDVHTGLCFHRHQWDELNVYSRRQRIIHVPRMPILLNARPAPGGTYRTSGDPPITEQSQESQELEIQEIEDMQRAIRLSLLEMEIDYTESLNNMFQEPEEIHLNNDEEGLETLYELYDNFVEWGGLGGWAGNYDDY